jgi:hypothetical protein
MKQTAVEWLEECLTEQYPNGKFVWNTRADIEALFKRAKVMEKEQRGCSEEEVKNIMAETWIQCVGNDGNNFKELRDKILKEFKNK